MRRSFISTLVAAVACAASVLLGTLTAQASSQSTKRVVHLGIVPPTEGARQVQVAVREDEKATLQVPDLGKFEFQPSFKSDTVVTVSIFDASANPSKRLGDVDAPVDGTVVHSKTSPSFGLRIVSVVRPK